MKRDEAHYHVKVWIDELAKQTAWHYGKVELHRDIDRIYDSIEESEDAPARKSVWLLHYGFEYESDTIFGVYSSPHKARKAKKALEEVTDNGYDYYKVSKFTLDEKEAK